MRPANASGRDDVPVKCEGDGQPRKAPPVQHEHADQLVAHGGIMARVALFLFEARFTAWTPLAVSFFP
jgi:hypothetical protein